MIRFFERQYIKFMLMRIARNNSMREKFADKYDDVFGDYGEDLSCTYLVKCKEDASGLYRVAGKKGEKPIKVVGGKAHTDDFGIREYVDQHAGYCEDDFYGTVYRKSLIPKMWLKTPYSC